MDFSIGSKRNKVAALALGVVAVYGAAAFTFSGCSDDTEYAYFSVKVNLSPAVDDETRLTIASCVLTVEGDDADYVALPCALNRVPYEIGTAEFSTNKRRGQLKFVAIMRNLNNEDVARGESPAVAIVPNMTSATSVTALPVSPQTGDAGGDPAMPAPDAGSPADGSASEAGTDAL